MRVLKKIHKILHILKNQYPVSGTQLKFRNPIDILVATILSAQCTDKRVNIVTDSLFKKYRKIEDYARARQAGLQKDIRSTGFYRNKARNIIGSAKKIISDYNGIVPNNMDELLSLPGVARKTANIVLHNAFGIIEGIAVDTHVRRLSGRLRLSRHKDPVKIEKDLMRITPKKDWGVISYLLIEHGRNTCFARNPKCHICALRKVCPSAKTN